MAGLKNWREEIDKIDNEIVELLRRRLAIIKKIAEVKRDRILPMKDLKREQEVLKRTSSMAETAYEEDELLKVFRTMMDESLAVQKLILSPPSPYKKIGIIGLGLIGGSIARTLKAKDPHSFIATVSNPEENHKDAFETKCLDKEYATLSELCHNVEILIIATPLHTIPIISKNIKKIASGFPLVIIDVGSVKKDIVTQFESFCEGELEFLSTHPMAGKETSGFSNSDITLFVDAPWFIVPHSKNKSTTVQKVSEFITHLGARPLTIQVEEHDQKTALVSHLPALIARHYLQFIKETDKECLQVAGPGFHSFTRLAKDNPVMWETIKEMNKTNIHLFFKAWLKFLKSKEEP